MTQFEPVKFALAAAVTHIVLVFIIMVGLLLVDFKDDRKPAKSNIYVWMIFYSLISLFVLLMSSPLYNSFKSVFNFHLNIDMSPTVSVYVFLACEYILFWRVIHITGGSKDSPFTPTLFMLPPTSIFLRLQSPAILTATTVAILIYSYYLYPGTSSENATSNHKNYRWAICWVSVACLLLTMVIGYLTRPM